jgi:hypothetical protein
LSIEQKSKKELVQFKNKIDDEDAEKKHRQELEKKELKKRLGYYRIKRPALDFKKIRDFKK